MIVIKKEIYHEIFDEIQKLYYLIKTNAIDDQTMIMWTDYANVDSIAALPLEIIKKINFYYGRKQEYEHKIYGKITQALTLYYYEEKS